MAERVGIEPTPVPQAGPTTVLKTARATRHPSLSIQQLLKLGLDRREDAIRLGKLTRGQFRVDFGSVHTHLKGTTCRRDQFHRADTLLETQNLFRQTDGFWLIVSSRAVFDGNFWFHPCEEDYGEQGASSRPRLFVVAFLEFMV